MATSRDNASKPPPSGRPLKSALDPILDSTAPSSFAVLSQAARGLGSSWSGGGERILNEVAPLVMTPRFIAAAASSSSSSSSSQQLVSKPPSFFSQPSSKITFPSLPRRPTSSSLQILEIAPSLLAAPIPDSPLPSSSSSAGSVSFLRGFQATVSADKGKERRRKIRGGLAEADLGGKVGVKKLGLKARGLLGGPEDAEGTDPQEGGKERRRRRREGAAGGKGRTGRGGGGGNADLSREELLRMEDEIGWDRQNLVVRTSLLTGEIEELSAKMDALAAIRNDLEDGILKLREEDLELEDELEGIRDRLFSLSTSESVKALGNGAAGPPPSTPSRRRKGPAFLPSEHDDLPSGVAFMTLSAHTGAITALDFSEPYGTLVTSALDETVRVWDLCSGEEVGRLRGHRGVVKAIQTDDQLCLTAGADGNVRLWDLRLVEDHEDRLLDEEKRERAGGALESLRSQAQASSGMMREEEASGTGVRDGEGDAKLEEEGSPCVRTLEGHSKSVTSLYYEEGCLVTGSSDKTIRQWDVQTGQCVLTMDILWAISNSAPPAPSSSSPYSSPTDSYGISSASLLSSATSGAFAVPTPPYADGSWEMYQDFVGGVQFWGYALASGSGDGGVRMWDMRTGQAHRTLVGHTGPVTCLQFDELHVVSGSLDKTIRIWDLRMGTVSDVLKYDYPVTALQFDSRKIVACAGENGLKVFNRTSRQQQTLLTNGHVLPAERVRYQDRYMVSGAKDHTVKVWSL